MVLIDLFVILILVSSTLLGIKDGFFKKVFGVLGFWGGFVLATKYMDIVGGWLISWLELDTAVAHIIGYAIIFTVVVVGTNLGYRWFGQSGKETLSPKSRITGGVFGFCEGLVLASLLFVAMSIFGEPDDRTRRESAFYYGVVDIAPTVFDYSLSWMPEQREFMDEIRDKFKTLTEPD
ncbi:MAG TPA: CvpA family protein [Candidatus Krumholzibacterium sp.]|nr:CvpA family protein [Candidatus Krumholzibacterium sp.]